MSFLSMVTSYEALNCVLNDDLAVLVTVNAEKRGYSSQCWCSWAVDHGHVDLVSMTILQFWLLSMLTSEGTPVSVGAPGQWIVATSGCVSPLNLVVMMLEVIARMTICLVAQIVFILASANLTFLMFTS
jgi:hypothetical protein